MWGFLKPRTFVFMPQRDGVIEKCRVLEETKKLYCVRHRVGLKGVPSFQWDEDAWLRKDDPRIIEVVRE